MEARTTSKACAGALCSDWKWWMIPGGNETDIDGSVSTTGEKLAPKFQEFSIVFSTYLNFKPGTQIVVKALVPTSFVLWQRKA